MSRAFLIVDDNPEFADNVAEILAAAGHRAIVATDPLDAVERVRGERFDGLITDMRMPGLSGAQLLNQVRRVDPGLPVVLLTAYANDAELKLARRDGVAAVLSKSQLVPRLLHTIEGLRRDALVVLVEDDVAMRENLSEALNERGYTVVGLDDLDELDATAAQPCVLLVDLRLKGQEFGHSLDRCRLRFPATPTLVITAFAHEAHSLEDAELFTKPFDTAALLRRIEALTPSPTP